MSNSWIGDPIPELSRASQRPPYSRLEAIGRPGADDRADQLPPHGCICPPTSEQTCQGDFCPRQPMKPFTVTCGVAQ